MCLIRVSHTCVSYDLPHLHSNAAESVFHAAESEKCVSYDLHSNAAEREKILMLLRERSVSIFILMLLRERRF